MLISEFIKNDELEFVENDAVKHLIETCLEEIHGVYGFNQPEWTNEKYWMFDELERDLNKIKSSAEMFTNVINHINRSFYQMSDSVITDITMGKSLFKYKEKPLYVRNGKLRLHMKEEVYPYMVMIKPLLSIYKETNPDVNIIISATRLDECSSKIRMMTSLNLLWLEERNRNINKNTKKRNSDFDNKPININRREPLEELVFLELFNNDENLTVDQVFNNVNELYTDKLIAMLHQGEISNDDLVDVNDRDGKSERLDVTNVSEGVVKRWIEVYIEEYKKITD